MLHLQAAKSIISGSKPGGGAEHITLQFAHFPKIFRLPEKSRVVGYIFTPTLRPKSSFLILLKKGELIN